MKSLSAPENTQPDLHAFEAIENVAWIRQGAIGDLMVGLAALEETARLFPNAKLHVIGPKLWLTLLDPQRFPYVSSITAVERRASSGEVFTRVTDGWRASGQRTSVRDALAKVEAVVNLNIDSYRYGWAAWRAKVGLRIGSAPGLMAALYTHSSPFFGKDPLVHERDAALMVLEYATSDMKRLFKSTVQSRRELPQLIKQSRLIARWREAGLPMIKDPDLDRAERVTGVRAGQYVLVNPTSSRRTNTWPAHKFRELLDRESESLRVQGVTPLLIGAPNETDWLKDCVARDVAIIQPANLSELADVLGGSRGLLTNTSSMQFFAASMKVKTVTLMGRASPLVWGPLGPRDQAICGEPPESLRHDIFAQEQAAYESIPLEKVAQALRSLVATE